MKKNIIIGVLVISNLLFLLYAFKQRAAADENLATAVILQEDAVRANIEAEKTNEMARVAQVHAEQARIETDAAVAALQLERSK